MSTETRVEQALRGWFDLHVIGSNQTVHLAVSGGLDSMALLHAAHAVHPHLHVLHVDHGLRPESDADRAFVEEVARTLSVPVTAHRVDGLRESAAQRGQGLEAAARAARYDWMCQQVGAEGILLTGHHANDQRETRLLHWLRGSKMEAWAGMPTSNTERGIVLGRPFLALTKAELTQWMEGQGWAWREDRSNADPVHLRNRVRHELLPLLDDLRPGWEGGLVRHAALAQEWADASDALLDALDSPRNVLPLDAVHGAPSPRALLARWARPWQWPTSRLDDLLHLCAPETEVGKEARNETHRIVRERQALTAVALDRLTPSARGWTWSPTSGEGTLDTPMGTLAWSVGPGGLGPDPHDHTAQLDLDRLTLPLTLRPWADGDRLEPLGMQGSQSVSDILTQRGVDHTRRKDALLVTQANGRAAWLVGHRIDRRAALPNAGPIPRMLSLSWTPTPA